MYTRVGSPRQHRHWSFVSMELRRFGTSTACKLGCSMLSVARRYQRQRASKPASLPRRCTSSCAFAVPADAAASRQAFDTFVGWLCSSTTASMLRTWQPAQASHHIRQQLCKCQQALVLKAFQVSAHACKVASATASRGAALLLYMMLLSSCCHYSSCPCESF